jgi:hypothetical protein
VHPYTAKADGCGCTGDCQVQTVSFAKRATYLFKYDAEDNSGNRAEQVVFALIIGDACGQTPAAGTTTQCDPEIHAGSQATQWQAAGSDILTTSVTTTDNVDSESVMKNRLWYKIEQATQGSATGVAMCSGEGFDHTSINGESWWSYEDYKQYQPKTNGEANFPFSYCATPAGQQDNNCPCALRGLRTSVVGRYKVTYMSCDKAGAYGAGAHNGDNCVKHVQTVIIKDTLRPWIEVTGGSVETQECHRDCTPAALQGKAPSTWPAVCYADKGSVVKDQLDTMALGLTIDAVTTWTEGNPDASTVDDYTITYDAKDNAQLAAKTMSRKVQVRDTKRPTASLVANGKQEKEVVEIVSTEVPLATFPEDREPGATCYDTCDTSGNDMLQAYSWGNKNWNEMVMGDYFRTYTCKDASNNVHSVVRKFQLVDKGLPIITLKDQTVKTITASNTLEYTDAGATCSDAIDGKLSHAVEISGDVVNRRVPGKYVVDYDCMDISQNRANTAHRTIIVKDDSCPTITMKGRSIMYVEAGFPWVDPGASASDDLDGDISANIVTDGDTIDTAQAFYSRRSCREIKAGYSAAKSGEYYITTYIAATSTWSRVLVHCDMEAAGGIGATYFPCDGCKAVRPYIAGINGDCTSFGLEMIQWTGLYKQAAEFADGTVQQIYKEKYYIPGVSSDYSADGLTDTYLCGINDLDTRKFGDHTNNNKIEAKFGPDWSKVKRAEAGKYVISYKVSDSSNNVQCESPKRTVIVRDTLPPVLTLHVRGSGLVQTSRFNHKGIAEDGTYTFTGPNNGHVNTPKAIAVDSGDYQKVFNHWTLMAENSASTNGWLIGAAASALAGVALLGYASRTAPTTVEV